MDVISPSLREPLGLYKTMTKNSRHPPTKVKIPNKNQYWFEKINLLFGNVINSVSFQRSQTAHTEKKP